MFAFPTVEYDLENQQNVLNGQSEDEHSQSKELFSRVVEIQLEVWDRASLWRVLNIQREIKVNALEHTKIST